MTQDQKSADLLVLRVLGRLSKPTIACGIAFFVNRQSPHDIDVLAELQARASEGLVRSIDHTRRWPSSSPAWELTPRGRDRLAELAPSAVGPYSFRLVLEDSAEAGTFTTMGRYWPPGAEFWDAHRCKWRVSAVAEARVTESYRAVLVVRPVG